MEAFQYRALDAAGRTVSGVLQADTARQARSELRARGLLPSVVGKIQNRTLQPWAGGLRAAELSMVTRQLAILLGSGLTLEQSFNALIEEAAEPMTREVLTGVKGEIAAGNSLAGAMGAYAKTFPDYYRALVHGGEESGALPRVLQHLADYLDARQAMRQKTSLALLYPVLVMIIALMIVSGLLIYVVPQVVQVFQQSRQSLPLLTRALIGLSDFLRGAWPFILLMVAGIAAAIHTALRHDAYRRRWHALLLRAPWLGPLVRGANTSRFASTLAIMVGGGVPLLAALESAARVMTSMVMTEAVERAIERVREGESLARALGETRAFPAMLVHMVASGEASGKLEQMLERVARLEAVALDRRLAVFLTLLEPAMILVMGGVVLLIVLAILQPIIEINQLVR